MKRRDFVTRAAQLAAAGIVACAPRPGPTAVRRIGYLSGQAVEVHDAYIASFVDKLRQLGHVDGRDIEMHYQVADARPERLPAMVAAMLAVPVDVIVADGGKAQQAATAATSTTPIVVLVGPDPVVYGFVTSLAHPGGNVTGVSIDPLPQNAKKLQLLKEVVPDLRRVAVIYRADNTSKDSAYAAQDAAPGLGLEVEIFPAADIAELDASLGLIARGAFDGIMTTSLLSVVRKDLGHIPQFAAARRLPQIFGDIFIARSGGGLMHYGPDFFKVHEEAAMLVDKILAGAWPGDLPVALPTKIDFVVNLAAAKRIGVEFPEMILRQATEAIS